MSYSKVASSWLIATFVLSSAGCAKKDSSQSESAAGDAAIKVDRSPAARAALVDRLNQRYQDKGSARIEGEALVISSGQCRDAAQARRVVAITERAAARVGIATVRCDAPPAPSKEELVAVFNERFADIHATARADDEGRTLTLTAAPCEKEGEARRLLRDAAPLSRDAGFRLIRCGAEGGTMFELALEADKAP